jgi:hypothetical protein
VKPSHLTQPIRLFFTQHRLQCLVLASSADSRPHRGVRTSSQSRVIRLLKICTVTAEDPETAGSLAVTDWQVSGQGAPAYTLRRF